MHDLVCLKYNHQLARKYNIRDEINLIVLCDIDECNECLVGQVDDDNDNEYVRGHELFFYDNLTLNCTFFYEASSVGEPITYTRRQATSRRKKSSSGGIVTGSSHASKKGTCATETPTKRGKENIQIRVGNELHASSDSKYKKLLHFSKSLSESEEEGNIPHQIILKTIMLEFKKSEIIRSLRHLFYVFLFLF